MVVAREIHRVTFDLQRFAIHFHEEIVLDEEIATDSKEIDDDHGKDSGQDHGFGIAHDTLNDIPQRVFTIDNIEQLGRRRHDHNADDTEADQVGNKAHTDKQPYSSIDSPLTRRL